VSDLIHLLWLSFFHEQYDFELLKMNALHASRWWDLWSRVRSMPAKKILTYIGQNNQIYQK